MVYSYSKCIDAPVAVGMGYEEAVEFFDFNTEGGWVGEKTPIVVHDLPED